MTDNEIIKGLEHCNNVDVEGCRDCPYRDENCINRIMADALDLIKRQRAELESAKREKEKPMFENTKHILHHLKQQIHDKAVRPHNAGIDAYIGLKVFDAILQGYLNKLG